MLKISVLFKENTNLARQILRSKMGNFQGITFI